MMLPLVRRLNQSDLQSSKNHKLRHTTPSSISSLSPQGRVMKWRMVSKFGHVGAPIRAITYVSMVSTPQANTLKLDDSIFATLE